MVRYCPPGTAPLTATPAVDPVRDNTTGGWVRTSTSAAWPGPFGVPVRMRIWHSIFGGSARTIAGEKHRAAKAITPIRGSLIVRFLSREMKCRVVPSLRGPPGFAKPGGPRKLSRRPTASFARYLRRDEVDRKTDTLISTQIFFPLFSLCKTNFLARPGSSVSREMVNVRFDLNRLFYPRILVCEKTAFTSNAGNFQFSARTGKRFRSRPFCPNKTCPIENLAGLPSTVTILGAARAYYGPRLDRIARFALVRCGGRT